MDIFITINLALIIVNCRGVNIYNTDYETNPPSKSALTGVAKQTPQNINVLGKLIHTKLSGYPTPLKGYYQKDRESKFQCKN